MKKPRNKPRTRKDMVAYLLGHGRYHTMNYWNNSTSYAHNVKVHNLGLSSEDLEKAYGLIYAEGTYDDINTIIEAFNERHNYKYQICFNGRSSGYLVLMRGGRKESDYKCACDVCGQGHCYAGVAGKRCTQRGCPGEFREATIWQSYLQPGKDIDQGETFSGWSKSEVKERFDIVWDFDRTVEECRKTFIEFVRTHKLEEREVSVTENVFYAVPV